MHIPDGLIAPHTYIPAFAIVTPLWALAWRRVRRADPDTLLPRIAVFTALAFVLSTLMIPLPGGTSAHALGIGLMALLFGPWTAFLAYTLVLLLQSLVMGAGGITALGVNALAMGFTGAWCTVLLARWLAPAGDGPAVVMAVWVGMVLPAALVALVLGVQPLLHVDDAGRPLFFPFGPTITLPWIVGPHAVVALGEVAVTLAVVRHARRRGWLDGGAP